MTQTSTRGSRLLVVTVGTDHHPFDRLIRWIDDWLGRNPRGVRCWMQVGNAEPPDRADWTRLVEFDELQQQFAAADGVACHSGPGTVALANTTGHVPIVVPRLKQFGEHVDDHQRDFARRLSQSRAAQVAESRDDLFRYLDSWTSAPLRARRGKSSGTEEIALRFGGLVAETHSIRRSRRPLRNHITGD